MKEIEQYIEAYFGITAKDLSSIAEFFKNESIKKNDFLLKMDQYTKSLSFVRNGYIRVYATSEDGEKEITQWICSQGAFITDLSSFIFNTPSRWNIQALSDCDLYTISKEDYSRIGNLVSNWEHLEKLFISKCFTTLENRVFNQLSMSAEQKVQAMHLENSEIFNQVPLQYIASMLGMTPETLSRVRKKFAS